MEPILTITGNLGSQPHMATRGGMSHCEFSVAHTPRILRNGEWEDGATTWIRVACWRRQAQNVVLSLGKGDRVVVTGRLRTSEWTDQSGEIRTRMVLEADAIGPDLSRVVAPVVRDNPSNRRGGASDPAEQPGATSGAGGEGAPVMPATMDEPDDLATGRLGPSDAEEAPVPEDGPAPQDGAASQDGAAQGSTTTLALAG